MKTLILILFPFLLNAQFSDKDKHYMASINIVNFAASSTTYFQYEICKNVRLSVSLAVGLTVGVAATNFKEDIWDKQWGLGHPSKGDKEAGFIGVGVGTVTYTPAHHKWFDKKMLYSGN
jgi:hypothetical protein